MTWRTTKRDRGATLDLRGQRFGRLVVIDRNGERWNCQCSCGATKLVASYLLREGKTRSCGCLRREVAATAMRRHRLLARHIVLPIAERFWAKVEKAAPGVGVHCWVWTGFRNAKGYGHFGANGKRFIASRFAWAITYGPIPVGLCVCHRCDNPPCVRPDHLFLGTISDNNQDAARKGRLKRWQQGENNGRAKLNLRQALEVQARALAGEKRQALADEFGVAEVTVRRIATGRTWRERFAAAAEVST